MGAYWKDILREIKATAGRFISLLVISALGAASVVGIQATSIDMRAAADKMYKERGLYDIHIKSSAGFGEEDIAALGGVPGVRAVMPSYEFDVYAYLEDAACPTKTYSLPVGLNRLELTDGRLPENSGECAVEQRFLRSGYKLGDTVRLGLDDTDEYGAVLAGSEFTIVGVVSSPLYMNRYERGRTSFGGGRLDFYLYLHPSAYKLGVYTDLYVQMDASSGMDGLSEKYNSAAEAWIEEIRITGAERVRLKAEEISGSRRKLEEGYAEYYAALDLIESGAAEGRSELERAAASLEAAKAELEQARAELAVYYEQDLLPPGQLEAMQAAIDAGWSEYYAGLAEYEAGLAALEAEYAEGSEELAEAKRELDAAGAELSRAPEPEWYYFSRKDGVSFDSYYQDTLRLEKIGYVFPVIFYLVAVMVTLTTMTRMVEEHRTRLGVYKALGYGTFGVMLKYLIYAVGASASGSVLGVFTGSRLFPRIISDAYGHLYNMPPIETPLPPAVSAVAVAAAVGSVAVMTVITCVRVCPEAPAQLMRPKPPQSGKRVLLERVPFIWNRFGFIGKVATRNIFRYKKRLFMTLAGVAGCSALLLTAFGLRDSIGSVAELQYGRVAVYDLHVYLREITESGRAALDARVAGGGSLLYMREESVIAGNGGAEIEASLVVPERPDMIEGFIRLVSTADGKILPLGQDGVVLTEKLARELGVRAGDTVKISAGEAEYSARVSGVAENYILNYIYMPPGMYEGFTGGEAAYNAVLVNTGDGALAEKLLSDENVRAVVDNAAQRASISDSTDALGVVTVVLIILACALALVVLFNLTNINITERIRELATIRVLGFYNSELAMYIYRENAVVTVLGILIGLAGGVLLHGFVLSSVEIDLLMFPHIIKFPSYAASVGLSAAFAVFVNLVMNFRLASIDMVGSLKNVE